MSQLLQTVNQHIDLDKYINVQALMSWYERYLSKYTNTRGKRITIGVAISLALLLRKVYRFATPPKQLRHIPHVSFLDSMTNFLYFRTPTSDMFHTLNKPLIRDNNGIYLRWDRAGWVVSVANPEAAKQVFMKSEIFPKIDVNKFKGSYFNKFVGSSNILLVNGEDWKKHRKISNPAFKRAQPLKLFNEITLKLFKALDTEYNSDHFVVADFGNLMERLTLDIIGRAGFDFDFNSVEDKNSEWKLVYDAVTEHLRNPLFAIFPVLEQKLLWLFPKRQEAHKLLDRFLAMLNGVVEHKRRVLRENQQNHIEEAEKDLLTLMIESELRGEGALTNEELMGDLGIFFVAGHDTTAFALSAAIYYLAKHPEVQEKARQEVIKVLCGDDEEPKADIQVTADHTKDFVYLNQVIKETLRINGSVVTLVTPRRATEDTSISGVVIPKDTLVNVNMYDLHHNPDVWNDPEAFNPDRFAIGDEADQKAGSGLYWTPFANGSRVCIGQNFSLMEQRVVLANLLRRYTWKLPDNSMHKDKIITGNSLIMAAKKLDIEFQKRF